MAKTAVPSPSRGHEIVNPQSAGSDPMHLHQTMLEVHKELSSNTAKLDRAIQDIGSIDGKLSNLSASFTWFRGFFAAAAVLIPTFTAVVWWLIGSQITDLKNEILKRPIVQTDVQKPAK